VYHLIEIALQAPLELFQEIPFNGAITEGVLHQPAKPSAVNFVID
jgi:hypothetical protein